MADAAVRWWEREEEPDTVWQACLTDDGLDFYVNTETNETTWDKPEELMTEEELNATGEWLWVPDEENVFMPAKLISSRGKKHKVEFEDGNTATVSAKKCSPCKRSWLKRVVADLTLLDDMGAPLILHNLKERFEKASHIYTNVGNILISINPYKQLSLYEPDILRKYANRRQGQELPPHPFNIAHEAMYGITGFKQPQSIIISGESGAGKTEATKVCLKYLAHVAGSHSRIEEKILRANPILEAFGNAKTLRNDNSSRFGKYLEVFFDGQEQICGSATCHYLLEKIRVVQPSQGERNFHIFYQLTSKAAPQELRNRLHLGPSSSYNYTNSCTTVTSIDDERDFKVVMHAFEELAFSKGEIDDILSLVGAILQLGNIDFEEARPDEAKPTGGSSTCVSAAADILKVGKEDLAQTLTTRMLRIRGQEDTRSSLSVHQAQDARDALCKFAYGRMFDWLVERVNKSMGGQSSGLYIGVLDIFGFEIFDHNSFEQLCINYTNEMLQQHFNNNTFKLEEKVYTEEGIDWDHIDFIDNQPMIELLTKKREGILPILDEELRVPNGSDKGFLSKLTKKHGGGNVPRRKAKEKEANDSIFGTVLKRPKHFTVQHYAGVVEYDSVGFLEKNRDTLNADLVELLQRSEVDFVRKLYPAEQSLSSSDRKASLSKQFQQQLRDLMRQLYATQPHYIRCIKPNEEKKALKFVPSNCYEQLTYSGVFEAVAIRKQGFPFRLSHADFASRYAKVTRGKVPEGKKDAEACKQIVSAMKLDRKNVQIGRTRVLYRAMEYRKLELDWSIITKNENIRADLKRLVGAVSKSGLAEKEKERLMIELSFAVRAADKFRISTPDAENARALLEKYVEERMDPKTKRDLESAKTSMDRAKLEEVLAVCDKEGYVTSLVRECRQLLSQIEDADAAIAVAMRSKREDYLKKAVDMCDEFHYSAPHVEEARKILKSVKKARQGIAKALQQGPNFKYKTIQKVVKFCESKGLQDMEDFSRLKKLERRISKVRQALNAAYDAVEQGALQDAIDLCDRKDFDGRKYRCQLEADTRELLDRVILINRECEKAEKQCIEDQVRTIVDAANQIGMNSSSLSKFRKLVKGDYATFLMRQQRCAIKCKDYNRAVLVSAKLKDEVMNAKSASSLSLENFSGFKSRHDWAGEKWFGKATASATMFKFIANSIHSPLTRKAVSHMDTSRVSLMKKKAINCFHTVQKIMCQRNSTHIPLRLSELLDDCAHYPELRDEVYAAIIKQCTENPDMAGDERIRRHAIELLALCASAFPPSDEFEDHVEFFIRSSDNLAIANKYSARFLLRRAAILGAVEASSLPGENEFVGSTRYNGRRYDGGAIEPVLASRYDENDFVEPDYTKKKASWIALRVRRSSISSDVLEDVRRDWG
eukprot:g183.t1